VAAFTQEAGYAVPLGPAQMAPLTEVSAQTWWSQLADADTIYAAGTGWEAYGEQLNEAGHVSILPEVTLPLAEDMLHWALQHGQVCSAEQLEPLYVRNEVAWKKLPGR